MEGGVVWARRAALISLHKAFTFCGVFISLLGPEESSARVCGVSGNGGLLLNGCGVFVFQMKNVPEMGGADGGAET